MNVKNRANFYRKVHMKQCDFNNVTMNENKVYVNAYTIVAMLIMLTAGIAIGFMLHYIYV